MTGPLMSPRIHHLNNGLLGLVAIGCFSLSFSKLVPFAISAGTTPQLAWILPLIIDGSIIIAICGHWEAVQVGKSVTPFRILNLSCAGLSVLFNVWEGASHASSGLTQSILVSGLAPILLWGTSETLLKNALHGSHAVSLVETGLNTDETHWHQHLHVETDQCQAMHQDGLTVAQIVEQTGLSRSSVYRRLKRAEDL